ncbi:MAG: hypothetical protein AAGD10_12625 [Myxococcota bacterium]
MKRAWPLLLMLFACTSELDERSFRRAAEKAYAEVHPGFTIYKREQDATLFVRGDQIDRLDVEGMWSDYEAAGRPAGFIEAWRAEAEAAAAARRQTLGQARAELVPVLKSKSWIAAQDLGAIGPERIRKQIRPWRQSVTDGVYVVLGVPEEKLGLRYASIEEVETSTTAAEDWLARAVRNLEDGVDLAAKGPEVRNPDGVLLAADLPNQDHVASLIFVPEFRRRLLKRFAKNAVGVAVPLRNVLIAFDLEAVTARKPVRARAHELYDTQNHPAFRGLLRMDADGVEVLEAPHPEDKGPG